MNTNSFISGGTSIGSVTSFKVSRGELITPAKINAMGSLLGEIENIKPFGRTGTPQTCRDYRFCREYTLGYSGGFNSRYAAGCVGSFCNPYGNDFTGGFNGAHGTSNGSVTQAFSMYCTSFAFQDATGNPFLAYSAATGTFHTRFTSAYTGGYAAARGTFHSSRFGSGFSGGYAAARGSYNASRYGSGFSGGYAPARGTWNNGHRVLGISRPFTSYTARRGTFNFQTYSGSGYSGYSARRGSFNFQTYSGTGCTGGYAARRGTFNYLYGPGCVGGYTAARGSFYANAHCSSFYNGRGNAFYCQSGFNGAHGRGGGTFNNPYGSTGTFHGRFANTGTTNNTFASGCPSGYCVSHTFAYSGTFNGNFCLSGYCASGFFAASYFSGL